MKVVLIEPSTKGSDVYGFFKLPLLGLPILGTILKQAGHDVQIYNERYSRVNPEKIEADIVGVSLLTRTAPRGYEILDSFRERGIRTMAGGFHATFMPEEALEHADYVCLGEGENSVVDIVEGRAERGIVEKREVDFANNPIPDFSLIVNGQENKGLLSRLINTPLYSMATSRGCMGNCDFCSVTQMFGRRYRTVPIDRVVEEIDRGGATNIFFYDDNFALKKKRTAEMMKEFYGRNITWSAQADVHVGDDLELLKSMYKAGCNYLYIGLESVNPKTLKSYRKGQRIEDMERCIKNAHKAGIRIHGMFVIGSDDDSPETIAETLRFCRRNHIETVQFLVLTPLPGTITYARLSDRIVTRNWSLYDGHHAVFTPKNFTRKELQEMTLKGMKKFYSWGRDIEAGMRGASDSFANLFSGRYSEARKRGGETLTNFITGIGARKMIKTGWEMLKRDKN